MSSLTRREERKREKNMEDVSPSFRENLEGMEGWDALGGNVDVIDTGWRAKDKRNMYDEGQKQRATNFAVSMANTKFDPYIAYQMNIGQRGLSGGKAGRSNYFLPALSQQIGATNAAMQSIPFQYDLQEEEFKLDNEMADAQMFQNLAGALLGMRTDRTNEWMADDNYGYLMSLIKSLM